MSKPTFVASFGAPQTFDGVARRRNLDDWDTFHVAALRVADYLHFNGDNSLMLAVLAEGSTIYPSALLEPTPRYDTGPFSSSGQDPMRKDIVELLYRVFDREGLVLIPELQFSSPLPALERQLAGGGPGAEGIELVGPDGRSWREAQGSVRGLAPYYNPLDTASAKRRLGCRPRVCRTVPPAFVVPRNCPGDRPDGLSSASRARVGLRRRDGRPVSTRHRRAN